MRLRISIAALIAMWGAATVAPVRADDAPLTERQKAVHVLNRLAYGPRPGDAARVEQMGVNAWVEQQLHPESIDDAALDAKLAQFRMLSLTSQELTKAYYSELKQFVTMQQKSGNTEEMKLRTGVDFAKKNTAPPAEPYKPGANEIMKQLATNVTLRALGELQTAKVMRAADSQRQLQEVLVDFWSNHFNIDVKKDPCRTLKIVDDREVIRPHVLGKFRRLLGASAASPAMLAYLDNTENSAPHEVSPFEQEMRAVVVKGYFGIDDGSNMDKATQPMTEGGLNENYARELLELHTLGVDGGYTQKDVEQVARCFTGWGLNPLTGGYAFEDRRHDNGEKTVLGQTIPAGGGVHDGMTVLDILAKHPSTARFIATKLCRRFIADEPPRSAVDRAAEVFLKTDGDLREVVKSIVTSPEFFSRDAYRAKVKSPLEFAISAVRATGASVEPKPMGFVTVQIRMLLEGAGTIGYGAENLSASRIKTLNWHVFDMGEPLFACQPPTGYTEDSRRWVSTGALISRLNYATALTGGDVMDVAVARERTAVNNSSPNEAIDRLVAEYLNGEVSDATRTTLMKAAAKDGAQLPALVLGSPEFQRR